MVVCTSRPPLPTRRADPGCPLNGRTWNVSPSCIPKPPEHSRLASRKSRGHSLQTSLGAHSGGRRASDAAFSRELPPEVFGVKNDRHWAPSLSGRALTSALARCRSVEELLELVEASRRNGIGHLGPVHVSTAFHRVARHGSRLPRPQQQVLKRHPTVQWLRAEACRRVGEMGAQSLGNVAWAHAEFGHGSAELMQGVAETAGPLVHTFQPLEVSLMLQAFSQCPEVRQGRPLMELLCRRNVLGRVAAYSPNNIKDILWSCAKSGMLDMQLIDELCGAVESRIETFGCSHLAVICWSLAKLGVPRPWLFRAVATYVAQRRDQLSPKDVANLAWAYAKQGVESPQLMAALATQGTRDANRFPAQSVSNTLWAFATLGHSNTGLLEAMCARLLALLEPFSGPEAVPLSTRTSARSPSAFPSQAFANSAWSLAVLGHYCPAFFQKLATACPRHLRSFTGQSLACLAFAFALVGHGSDPLFQALELEVESRLRLGTPNLGGRRSMVMLAWALALSRSGALALAPTAGKGTPRVHPSTQQHQGQGLALLRQHLLELCGEFSGEELCQLYQVELVARHLDASLDPALFPVQHHEPTGPQPTAPAVLQKAPPGTKALTGEGRSPETPSGSNGSSPGAEGLPAQPGGGSLEGRTAERREADGGGSVEEEAPESHVYLRRLWLAGTLQQQAKASWAAAHEEDKRKQSAFQAGAAEALASLGLRAEEEHWEGDYSVDLAVCLPLPSLLQQLQGQGQGPAQSQKGQASGGYTGGVPWVKIAVEVDGPSHFARSLCHCAQGPLQGGSAAAHGAASGSGKSQGLAEGADRGGAGCQAGKTEGALGTARDGGGRVVADSGPEGEGLWALGPTRLKTQLLKAMGWVVVQVPFAAWDRLALAEERGEFMRQHILAAMGMGAVAAEEGLRVHPGGTKGGAVLPGGEAAHTDSTTSPSKGPEGAIQHEEAMPGGGADPSDSEATSQGSGGHEGHGGLAEQDGEPAGENDEGRSQERAAAARKLVLKGARARNSSAGEEPLSRKKFLLQEVLGQKKTPQALRNPKE